MNENCGGRVFYVCFYSEPELENKIISYPSVISKIDYVVESIKKLNKEVVILSIAPAKGGFFGGYSKRIDRLESHIYLRSVCSENKYLQKICYLRNSITILSFLLKNVKKKDAVIVYHSLYNRLWLRIYRKLVPERMILQIEDVFSELTENARKFRKYEWALFRKMKKCICVNDIIYEKLPEVPKKIISYGSYKVLPDYPVVYRDAIRLVYAGVIEQERRAAFLAADAMRHLSNNYELHILGFGNDENIDALEVLLRDVNEELGRTAVFYHGRLTGEEYWKFLQSCDIALSTHAYTTESFASATYTFPSKVLTYLANGLRVVAQRLDVLERSAVAEYFRFYETPDPKQIADTIAAVDLQCEYDSRTVIAELDEKFVNDLKNLLDRAF